jgi:hypothetical protein
MAANGSFKAFRPKSSSELLALRRIQIQQSLNTVPSINYQDASEQTARVRKFASVISYKNGDSATMVKNKASSVVQAQREGAVYRTAATTYQPRVEYMTPGCSNILTDPVRFPKEIRCNPLPIQIDAPRVVPFNPTVDLPLRRNDNSVVIAASSVNTRGCGANQ